MDEIASKEAEEEAEQKRREDFFADLPMDNPDDPNGFSQEFRDDSNPIC